MSWKNNSQKKWNGSNSGWSNNWQPRHNKGGGKGCQQRDSSWGSFIGSVVPDVATTTAKQMLASNAQEWCSSAAAAWSTPTGASGSQQAPLQNVLQAQLSSSQQLVPVQPLAPSQQIVTQQQSTAAPTQEQESSSHRRPRKGRRTRSRSSSGSRSKSTTPLRTKKKSAPVVNNEKMLALMAATLEQIKDARDHKAAEAASVQSYIEQNTAIMALLQKQLSYGASPAGGTIIEKADSKQQPRQRDPEDMTSEIVSKMTGIDATKLESKVFHSQDQLKNELDTSCTKKDILQALKSMQLPAGNN